MLELRCEAGVEVSAGRFASFPRDSSSVRSMTACARFFDLGMVANPHKAWETEFVLCKVNWNFRSWWSSSLHASTR